MKKSRLSLFPFVPCGIADVELRDWSAPGKEEGTVRGAATQGWEKEGDRARKGRKRNRDITFARYRLIGITRFSIVSESSLSCPIRSPPPFCNPPSLCRVAYPASWSEVQSAYDEGRRRQGSRGGRTQLPFLYNKLDLRSNCSSLLEAYSRIGAINSLLERPRVSQFSS